MFREVFANRKMKAGFLVSLCALWVVGGRMAYGEEQVTSTAAYVDTVREGLAYRAAVIRTLTGMADLKYTFTADQCKRSLEEAKAYAEDSHWTGEVLPLDPVHKSRLEFGVDFEKGQWRCDMLDLTVSGHNLWASSNHPALNRHLPPDIFQRVSVSDGVKIYDYHQSTKEGWIESHTGSSKLLPQPLLYIQAMVVGVSTSTLETMTDSRYSVSFLGEEVVADRNCLKLVVSPEDPSLSGWTTTLWCAPDLDFAVVREEACSYAPPKAPGEDRVLVAKWVGANADFEKLSDLVWYPRTQARSFYRYRPDAPEGADPMEYTRIIHFTSLVANAPVTGIVTPYPFPRGTSITDSTVPRGTVDTAGK